MPVAQSLASGAGFGAVALAYRPAGYLAEALTGAALSGYTFDAAVTHVSGPKVVASVQGPPSLVFDGAEFLVDSARPAAGTAGPYDVYGAALDMTGALATSFSLFGESIAERVPTLASIGNGRSMVAGSRAEPGRAAAVVLPITATTPVLPPPDAGTDAGIGGDDGGTDGGTDGDDGGTDDASSSDASREDDAGAGDAAGPVDAAGSGNAGVTDAASGDAAVPATPGTPAGKGCACGNGFSPALGLAVLAALVRLRRRSGERRKAAEASARADS